jgi:hypothetical protein
MDVFKEEGPEELLIFLKFNNKLGKKKCSLTGKDFETYTTLGFFLDNDLKRPVSPRTALVYGFTMEDRDFLRLCRKVDAS